MKNLDLKTFGNHEFQICEQLLAKHNVNKNKAQVLLFQPLDNKSVWIGVDILAPNEVEGFEGDYCAGAFENKPSDRGDYWECVLSRAQNIIEYDPNAITV